MTSRFIFLCVDRRKGFLLETTIYQQLSGVFLNIEIINELSVFLNKIETRFWFVAHEAIDGVCCFAICVINDFNAQG